MSRNRFFIVDVFAEKKYSGNQLAVVLNAGNLSSDQMQAIALEMNYSETTFILSDKPQNSVYPVRFFTPVKEIPFAGHPTIGTAFIIQREIVMKDIKKLTLKMPIGDIPVKINYKSGAVDLLYMSQKTPTFDRQADLSEVAELLQLSPNDISTKYPCRVVSTGVPTLIVPLNNLDSVKKANTDARQAVKYLERLEVGLVLVFSPETYQESNDLNVRVFADYYGIHEDPATGSACGCLAGYLAEYEYFGAGKLNITVEQGYEINRPSLLYLNAEKTGNGINVQVGGKVVLIAAGELF